ncbi:hypothetical protein SAMN02927921_02527 [Sinomicrobium oceani]|uniref:SnoaL-like domain-containing protein n=1 Tax=Sinomicrobium oceani TaxID=1150368 RepID=A0A1K1QGT8_9FLAO|nr:hypothetical protein [Sinomicrobium oceani]SFW58905.1 hypothetical protein SAMN02927921_02527 [Sinomicrobium oceani]
MQIPEIIENLVSAQNSQDSISYAGCFSETAVVIDEGKTYTGQTAIRNWIAEASEKYNVVMKPVSFQQGEPVSVLKAEISGNFQGSPVILSYKLAIENERISSLEITL